MLRTIPKWSKWKVDSDNSKSNTSNPRSSSQTETGAEKSAPVSPVNLLEELKPEVNVETSNLIKKIPSKVVKNSRVKQVDVEELDDNEYESKGHLRRGWSLSEKREGNLDKAPRSFDYESLRNRKLGSNLSLMFSKIAEERMGDKTQGSDKWDIEKIMFRRISKKVITDCKYSREKKRLVLMLDSSPSCSRMAKTYSKIATESANFDDIEIYDAPNGYVHSVYDSRIKKFRALERDELDYTYLWNGFQNRTIIYFGDSDATRSIQSSYKHNDLHWFYQRSYHEEYTYEQNQSYLNGISKRYNHQVKIYECCNVSQLIQAVRDMR